MDITSQLRTICGHDSRSVDGCVTCEAADDIETLRRAIHLEREKCAVLCESFHHNWRWDDSPDSNSGPRECAAAIRAME